MEVSSSLSSSLSLPLSTSPAASGTATASSRPGAGSGAVSKPSAVPTSLCSGDETVGMSPTTPMASKRLFWPSKKINLFYESNEKKINFLNFNEDSNNLLYVFENDKIKDILNKEIRKKKIKIIRKSINQSGDLDGYDLKVLCLGRNSKIYQSVIKSRSIEKDYREMAWTGYVKHNIKNISTSQFFLKEGPLAILP